MAFHDPVRTPIHPASWVRPAGNLDFKVTSPFGPRVINGVPSVHKGLDLGNGREGFPVFAQAAGRVVEFRPTTDGVVTIQTPDGRWRLVSAHCRDIRVALGSIVTAGQHIAFTGSVGAPGQPHLHIENKEFVVGVWVPRDPWPLMEQQQGGDDSMTIVTYTPFPEGPRTWVAKTSKTYTGYKPDGSTKAVTLSAGSNAPCTGTAVIQQDPQKAPNGSGFVLISAGVFAGYYMVPTDGTVSAPPPAPGGDTAAAEKKGANDAAAAAKRYADALP